MAGTSYRTAPAGTICCFLCHRYLPPEKFDGHRCSDRASCQRAAARMLGRPPRQPVARHLAASRRQPWEDAFGGEAA